MSSKAQPSVTPGPYGVFRHSHYAHGVHHDSGWLLLDGPFAYARWGPAATPMSFAWAHAFANAYGGEVQVINGGGS